MIRDGNRIKNQQIYLNTLHRGQNWLFWSHFFVLFLRKTFNLKNVLLLYCNIMAKLLKLFKRFFKRKCGKKIKQTFTTWATLVKVSIILRPNFSKIHFSLNDAHPLCNIKLLSTTWLAELIEKSKLPSWMFIRDKGSWILSQQNEDEKSHKSRIHLFLWSWF